MELTGTIEELAADHFQHKRTGFSKIAQEESKPIDLHSVAKLYGMLLSRVHNIIGAGEST